ncbi:MAG: hypothetical protein AB7W47_17140 [Calditrichaceae bacterium]
METFILFVILYLIFREKEQPTPKQNIPVIQPVKEKVKSPSDEKEKLIYYFNKNIRNIQNHQSRINFQLSMFTDADYLDSPHDSYQEFATERSVLKEIKFDYYKLINQYQSDIEIVQKTPDDQFLECELYKKFKDVID